MSFNQLESIVRPKKKVSSYLPIQSFMDNIGMEDNRMIPVLQTWVNEADEKIGSYYAYERKIKVLNINNCKVELPCDVVAVLGVMLGDQGCECDVQFGNYYSNINAGSPNSNVGSPGFAVIDVSSGVNSTSSRPYYIVQGNSLVFSEKVTLEKVTVQYLGYIMDDDGFIMVNDTHVDAIAQYLEMKLAKKYRFIPAKRMSETAIREIDREWHRKCAHARAEDGKPSESEILFIKNLINDPTSGVGLAMWVYNDVNYGGYYG